MTMPKTDCIIPESMMWPSSSTTRETVIPTTTGAADKSVAGGTGQSAASPRLWTDHPQSVASKSRS